MNILVIVDDNELAKDIAEDVRDTLCAVAMENNIIQSYVAHPYRKIDTVTGNSLRIFTTDHLGLSLCGQRADMILVGKHIQLTEEDMLALRVAGAESAAEIEPIDYEKIMKGLLWGKKDYMR